MTKLKTLKDLGNDAQWIGRETLKQEAIKWINSELEMIDKGDEETALMSGFMEFFNIKEEDLK